MTKTVVIAIDSHKLKTFTRVLTEAGYAFTKHPGIAGTLLLKVKTDSVSDLQPVVQRANLECKS